MQSKVGSGRNAVGSAAGKPSTRKAANAALAKSRRRKRLFAILGVSLLVTVMLAGGTYVYQTRFAPFRATVLTVDGSAVKMDYFLKRVRMAGSDASSMLQQLAYEQLVKTEAPKNGIAVSETDIDDGLQSIALGAANEAAGDTTTIDEISEADFQAWYQNLLKTTGLSDGEYRDIVRTELLAAHLHQNLVDQVPEQADQIHAFAIVTSSSSDAEKARDRIASGEAFSDVATEVSEDTQTKDNGGDLGWLALGATDYDGILFQLDAGGVSEPVALNGGKYALFMVSEKAANRNIDDQVYEVLKSRALYNWLIQELPNHNVKYNLSEKRLSWVNAQIVKSSGT